MKRRLLFAVVFLVSCNDIESRRRSTAPLNASAEFPCDRYSDTTIAATPVDGRCIVQTSVTYDFTILVNVPESSFFAPGQTFVLPDVILNKTLTVSGSSSDRRAKLPVLGTVVGAYTVKRTVSDRELFPYTLPDGQSIPVNAVYVPVGKDATSTYDPALPLDVVFASSQRDDNQSPSISYVRTLPPGKWQRSFEPAPPYDSKFPPFVASVVVKPIGNQFDFVDIGGANGDFDDIGGRSRDAHLTRAEGLEGWTAFLRDKTTGRRISTLKTVCQKDDPPCPNTSGKTCCSSARDEVFTRLDTIGRGTVIDQLGPVEQVLAPPAGWIGVPTLINDTQLGGDIFLPYPALRPPVALEGIVAASAEGGTFLSVSSRVTFDSETILLPDGKQQPLLHYSSSVSTDDRGRFATVIPPGAYRVTVEPLEGTGFASFRKQVVVEDNKPITLQPPRRTRVRGMAMLTDGRPAFKAEVVAVAEPQASTTAQPAPRPARTTVLEDGSFTFDLDQGPYALTVIPEEGTGFPRVVTRATIPADQADVGTVRIPAPARINLQIADPTTLARPIPFANVRIFASPEKGPLLEIASGMTNGEGKVEILLAQRPK